MMCEKEFFSAHVLLAKTCRFTKLLFRPLFLAQEVSTALAINYPTGMAAIGTVTNAENGEDTNVWNAAPKNGVNTDGGNTSGVNMNAGRIGHSPRKQSAPLFRVHSMLNGTSAVKPLD
jgi:hypothetical protein